MLKRKSNIFIGWLLVITCALFLVFVHAYYRGLNDAPFLRERMSIVKEAELTDLCLFTEARYTRNPAVADFATPFQDHPASMEHFPSGSIIAPSKHLVRRIPG
jgi:hypothetical protein